MVMKVHSVLLSIVVLVGTPLAAAVTTLDFEDIPSGWILSGNSYAGVYWESGATGDWKCNSGGSSYPHSGVNNITNTWGCTQIGIRFAGPVNVLGAWFAGQGNSSLWTSGIRVHGFLEETETAVTGWFTDIDSRADWFAMDLLSVDRIVIEAAPVFNGGGWFGLDDLTYEVPEPASVLLLAAGAIVLRRRRIA